MNWGSFPKHVEVGGKVIKVTITPLKDVYGVYSGPRGEIFIARDHASFEEAVDTLIHEALHAMENECGLRYNEKWVWPMTKQLILFLRSNPKVLKLIDKKTALKETLKPHKVSQNGRATAKPN